jgi:hypothetical protein
VSHTAPAALLPIFLPSERVTSGAVTPNAGAFDPAVRWIRSMPAVMFPYWSEPAICTVQPIARCSCWKSAACSNM